MRQVKHPNLEDKLADEKLLPAAQYKCACGFVGPAFAFAVDNDDNNICGSCVLQLSRESARQTEMAVDTTALDWDSELGNEVRAKRNALLDQYRWTVAPDSPLTSDCQTEFLVLLKWLQKLTAAYATPFEALGVLSTLTIPSYQYEE